LPPESDYRFKHALIQDAAYENLLKSRRQALHRRVAEILRDRFGDSAAAEPEALAHHFTQAGMTDAAIEWWGKAGDQALRRSAFQEAIAHLGKAIEMAEKVEAGSLGSASGPISADRRARLQSSYARAVIWSRGFGPETKEASSRALELAAKTENIDERFNGYYGLCFGHLARAELAFATETAERFRRDAEIAGRTTEAAVAHRFLGLIRLCQGDLDLAQANCEQALRLYDPERDREVKFRFGLDTEIAAFEYLAH
jgi:tetratricopeptide (TPR) repeat protein